MLWIVTRPHITHNEVLFHHKTCNCDLGSVHHLWRPPHTLYSLTVVYRDNMIPIEPTVANQLEAGYRELRPYSEDWKVEIGCAVEVGAEGEEKVSWPLWSTPVAEEEPSEPPISCDPFCAAHCFRGEAAAEGTLKPAVAGDEAATPPSRNYASYHVIYKDATLAFLLKPSLKPSAYYSRRPVSKIMKGLTIGMPVVRGFDREAWDALHEKKRPTSKIKTTLKAAPYLDRQQDSHNCPGCEAEKKRGQVTDLVLVAHGMHIFPCSLSLDLLLISLTTPQESGRNLPSG